MPAHLSATDRLLLSVSSPASSSLDVVAGSSLAELSSSCVASHAEWLANERDPTSIKQSIQWMLTRVTALHAHLRTMRSSGVDRGVASVALAELAEQFFDIDEFVESRATIILASRPTPYTAAGTDSMEEMVSMLAAWGSENSTVQTIRAGRMVAEATSPPTLTHTAPTPLDRTPSLTQPSESTFILPNSLPSPSKESVRDAPAAAAAGAEPTSLVPLVTDTAKRARKILGSHFLSLLSQQKTPSLPPPPSDSMSRAHELVDLLSRLLPLPRLALEFQRWRHTAWGIQTVIDTPAGTSAAVMPLESLRSLAHTIVDSFESDLPLLSEVFAPLCAEYVTLHPVAAAASAAPRADTRDPARVTLFAPPRPQLEKKPSKDRRHSRTTLTVPAHGQATPMSPSSTSPPAAHAVTVAPAVLPAPHRHPFSLVSLLRSVYLLPLVELCRRWLQSHGSTLDALLPIGQIISQDVLTPVHQLAAQVMTRGAMPTLNWSCEEDATGAGSGAALPLPLLSLSNDLLVGLTDFLYDDLLAKVDRAFASQMKSDSVPTSVGVGSTSTPSSNEYTGAGEEHARRISKSNFWTQPNQDFSTSPSANSRALHATTHASTPVLAPFSPVVPATLPISGGQSQREYDRSQAWKVCRTSVVSWTQSQADERFTDVRQQLASGDAGDRRLLDTLPLRLPRGYYFRLDSNPIGSESVPPRGWLVPLPLLAPDEVPPVFLHSASDLLDVLGQVLPLLSIPGSSMQPLHDRCLSRLKHLLSRYLENIAKRVGAAPRGASIAHAILAANTAVALKAQIAAIEHILVSGASTFAHVHLATAPPTNAQPVATGSRDAVRARSARRTPSPSPPRAVSSSPPPVSMLPPRGSISGSLTNGSRSSGGTSAKRLAPLPLPAPITVPPTKLRSSGSMSSLSHLLTPVSNATTPITGPTAAPSPPPIAIESALAVTNASLRARGLTASLAPISDLLSRMPSASSTPQSQRERDREHPFNFVVSGGGGSGGTGSTSSTTLHPGARRGSLQLPQLTLDLPPLAASQVNLLRCHASFHSLMDQLDVFLLRCVDAQALDGLFHTLHASILPNIAAFEWSKKRDLPPILSKRIVKPSPTIFHIKAFFTGLIADCDALPAAIKRHILLHVVFHASLGVKESLLSLVPSRFHSRQHFVDVASALVLFRSLAQYVESLFADADANAGADANAVLTVGASSPRFLLDQLNLVLAELALVVVVTHPTAMSLAHLARVLQRWETTWTDDDNKDDAAAKSNATHRIDCGSIAAQLDPLWNCDPFVTHVPSEPSPSGGEHTPTNPLRAFFSMPPLKPSAAADATLNASFPHCIPQDLPLECDAESLLAGARQRHASDATDATGAFFTTHFSPSTLLRAAWMRHQLREDDFPVNTDEEETQASAVRAQINRLRLKWA